MESVSVWPGCEASLDLSQRNAIPGLVYRNVSCPVGGIHGILEGPERNVLDVQLSPGH